jgi:uncharacterized membrane protein YeiH
VLNWRGLDPLVVQGHFQIPVWFDLTAVFFFAITGVLVAMRRDYDFIGVFMLALVTGVGGALIRDGLFIQKGPPAVATDGRYLIAVVLACPIGVLLGNLIEQQVRLVATLDAVGLGTYAIVGMQKSFEAGLSVTASLLVGILNACGGALLRDVLVREEPLLFKPGQFYVVAAMAGCGVFLLLKRQMEIPVTEAALIAIGVTVTIRILSIYLNWRTTPIRRRERVWPRRSEPPGQ